MAKKGQQSQLQVEVNNDEDWEKLLTREGLIIVDVYSEWCGPCAAMQANLRKLKLEFGGDFMHLALAKSDGITALKRFQNRSEPTWMFVAGGQMVQLIFGSNAPALQQSIMDELKKEQQCMEGLRTRVIRSPDELSEEEQAQVDAIAKKEEIKQKILEEKLLKQEKEQKLAQAKNILTTYAPTGLIVVFPHAFLRAAEVVEKTLNEYGLAVGKREKPIFTEPMLDDIEYFATFKIPEQSRPFILNGEKCMAYTITLLEGTPGPIDDAVLSFVYGQSKCPPGEPDTPSQILIKSRKPVPLPPVPSVVEEVVPETQPQEAGAEANEDEGEGEKGEEEQGEERHGQGEEGQGEERAAEIEEVPVAIEEDVAIEEPAGDEPLPEGEPEPEPEEDLEDIMGVWAPSNELVKATALRYALPNIMQQFILPEPEPAPPHVAVVFDAFKRDEVLKAVNEFQDDVMALGFFTDQDPETAVLIAKTPRQFEKTAATTVFGEKMILKVSKKRSDPLLAFAQIGPTYISGDVDQGETECAIFFPEDYNESIMDEDAQKLEEKKVKKSKVRMSVLQEMTPEEIIFEEGVIGELPEGQGESEGEEIGQGGIEGQGESEGEDIGQGEMPYGQKDIKAEGVVAEGGVAASEMTELPPVEAEEVHAAPPEAPPAEAQVHAAPAGLEEPVAEDRATSPMDAPPPVEEGEGEGEE